MIDRFNEGHREVQNGIEECERLISSAKDKQDALMAARCRLEERLQDCQFRASQFATVNSVVALEGQVIATQKRLNTLERKMQSVASQSRGLDSEVVISEPKNSEEGRLCAAAPVTLTSRGRSLDHCTIDHDDISRRIASAQGRARSREFNRSTSRDRGAFISPNQNREALEQALDRL